MKSILLDLFLFSLGIGFGVVTMYFMRIEKAAEKEIETMRPFYNGGSVKYFV